MSKPGDPWAIRDGMFLTDDEALVNEFHVVAAMEDSAEKRERMQGLIVRIDVWRYQVGLPMIGTDSTPSTGAN